MNQFVVNGVVTPSPLEPAVPFVALLTYIQSHMIHESALVSSIRVNGIELGASDEKALADIPLADLDTVEVVLSHPRAMAEDTLQTLLMFTERLADMSRKSAEELGTSEDAGNFERLIDGMQTFTESVSTVRSVLRIGILQPVQVLEADMLSIMRDILEAKKSGNRDYLIQLLQDHLPINLHDWCVTGLPAMICARSS